MSPNPALSSETPQGEHGLESHGQEVWDFHCLTLFCLVEWKDNSHSTDFSFTHSTNICGSEAPLRTVFIFYQYHCSIRACYVSGTTEVISFNHYNTRSFNLILQTRNRLSIKQQLVQGHTESGAQLEVESESLQSTSRHRGAVTHRLREKQTQRVQGALQKPHHFTNGEREAKARTRIWGF